MRWLSGAFWIAIAVVSGMANYTVKHMVQSLDDELTSVRRKTVAAQKEIHALNADWTYLNQPELLTDLNRRYVGLVPLSSKQVQRRIDDIPLRPAPAPAEIALDEAQIAAAPAAPPTAPIVPVVAAVPPPAAAPAPSRPQQPASLDALFAQVAGDR